MPDTRVMVVSFIVLIIGGIYIERLRRKEQTHRANTLNMTAKMLGWNLIATEVKSFDLALKEHRLLGRDANNRFYFIYDIGFQTQFSIIARSIKTGDMTRRRVSKYLVLIYANNNLPSFQLVSKKQYLFRSVSQGHTRIQSSSLALLEKTHHIETVHQDDTRVKQLLSPTVAKLFLAVDDDGQSPEMEARNGYLLVYKPLRGKEDSEKIQKFVRNGQNLIQQLSERL